MPESTGSYVVISPARDEAERIEQTVQSMVAQSYRPAEWVIVNDGSTDETGAILDHLAAEHEWIRVVHRQDRGFRAAGTGVMEAFSAGLAALKYPEWQFLVKLDADLVFQSDYFERCFERFAHEPRLGIGGGVIYNMINGREVLEQHPRFHVRGATKIYRRECWDAIGGLVKKTGWDTLDEVHAQWLGWDTRSFYDTKLVQLRHTGQAAGEWSNWTKNGHACFVVGYHPIFMLARSAVHLLRRGRPVAAAGMLWGYGSAALAGVEKVASRDVIRFVRREQLRRLAGRSSMWR